MVGFGQLKVTQPADFVQLVSAKEGGQFLKAQALAVVPSAQ